MKSRLRTPSSGKTRISARKAKSDNATRVTLHQNPWFSVCKRDKYYTIEYRQPQAIILPIVDGRGLVLVRVKRPVINDIPLELPAGGIDAGEAIAEGAAREFSEETGIHISDAARFIRMPSLSAFPSRMPDHIHVFRVDITRQEFDARGPHDEEIAGVEYVSFSDAARRIFRGDIYVAAPLAVIATFLLEYQKKTLRKLQSAARKKTLA
jgi:8-oxo-dGTP pyrophosphatase MutT (NUDIX family)